MAKLFSLAIVLVISASCTTNTEMVKTINVDLLINCWTHSMEEDPDSNTQVYRQCSSKDFPASRFRMFMDLKSDGTCEYLELSPVDAHQVVQGTWAIDEAQARFSLFNEKGASVFESNIIALEADRIDFSI